MSPSRAENDLDGHPKLNKRGKFSFSKRRGVDSQVFFLTAIIVIISCSTIFLICYHLTYGSMISDLKDRAYHIHSFLESQLTAESFSKLRSREDAAFPVYQESKQLLEKTREVSGVRYLYTACQNEDGDFIYLVDGLPAASTDFRFLGDPIEQECLPEMKRALSGETVLPEDIVKTSWGSVFISYFPMHDQDQIIGVLGIEFDAKRQYATYQGISCAAPLIIFLSCLVAAGIAVLFFRRISNPTYQDMANTDFLTGQKNRNAFEVDLHNLAQSSAKKNTAFISIDLDGLKKVNDTYGHKTGDQYIKDSCAIIAKATAPHGVLYRIGGDEFVVILQNQQPEELENMVSKIKKLSARESLQAKFPLSLSTGWAIYEPSEDESLSNALNRSDARMYEQKRLKYAEKDAQG